MKRLFLLVFLPLLLYSICSAQSDEDRILERYKKFLITTTPQTPAEIQSLVANLKNADKQAAFKNPGHAKTAVIKILQNTRDLSIAWSTPGSSVYQDSSTVKLIHFALNEALKFSSKNQSWSLSQVGTALAVRDIVVVLNTDL